MSPSPLKKTVRVRTFRPADLDQVHKLYVYTMGTGPSSLYKDVLHFYLKSTPALIIYVLVSIGTILALQPHSLNSFGFPISTSSTRTLGLILASTFSFFLCLFLFSLRKKMMERLYESLQKDMKTIHDHYRLVEAGDGSKDWVSFGPTGFWVAEVDKDDGGYEIVGCVGLDAYSSPDLTTAEVRRLFVSPHYRRHGIAASLLGALKAHAQKYKKTENPELAHPQSLYLNTSHYNAAAVQMYKRTGWKIVRKRKITALWGLIQANIFDFSMDI
ncbi:acyl-CoA N-acyltransferase [Mycena floridula]|nr:acyl-CoA N-acyltransferase [Mycena floridula]